jgi:hypothetical protein
MTMSLGAPAPGDESGGGGSAATAAPDVVVPDYGGAWIGAILPALRRGVTPPGLPAWVGTASPVVVLLVDGVGWAQYQRFRPQLPALDGAEGGPVTSVVPATTATALPSLTTGLPPAAHGMLGDKIRVGGRVLSVLQWTVARGRPPDPAQVQPMRPFADGAVEVVSGAAYAGSGFSRAHLRGAPYHGFTAATELPGVVAARLRAGVPLVYAYLPDVDRTAHEVGMDHAAFGDALARADAVIAGIRRALPPGGVLVVTADHGQVTTDPAERVHLGPLTPLVAAMAGSTRLRYLHARPGAAAELLAAATELAGDRALVRDRATVAASGWLGPTPSPMVAGRLGDVVMAARGAATMVDPDDLRQAQLVTMHGSLTAAEQLVPLLALPGG